MRTKFPPIVEITQLILYGVFQGLINDEKKNIYFTGAHVKQ